MVLRCDRPFTKNSLLYLCNQIRDPLELNYEAPHFYGKTMTQDVDNLIKQLLHDHQAVQPELHPLLKTAPLLLAIVIYMSVVTAFIGLRSDWKPEFVTQFGVFQFELMLSFIVGLTALLATGWLRIPYMKSQPWIVGLALTSAAIFLGFEVFRLISEGITFATLDSFIECYVHSLFLAAAPTALLVFMQKSGSPTKPYLSALMGTLAIAGFAWICLRLTCSVNLAGHNAIVQLSPFMLLGAGLGIYAKRLYRW